MNNPYKNIKVAVFLAQYGILLLGGAILIIVVAGLWPSFNLYLILGLMIGIILRTFFIQIRYVTEFEINDEVLHIRYITPLFIQHTYQKPLSDIKDIQLENAGELNVVTTGKWETFDIVNKKIKRDIEVKVTSANKGFTKYRLRDNG
jgi:hypothetical protein